MSQKTLDCGVNPAWGFISVMTGENERERIWLTMMKEHDDDTREIDRLLQIGKIYEQTGNPNVFLGGI